MANLLTVPTNSSRASLKDHLLFGMSLPKLKEGEITNVKLLPFEIIANDNGEPIDAVYVGSRKSLIVEPPATPLNPNPTSYVRLELQLQDRVIIDNKFTTGFAIFESHIKEQLKLDDEPIPVLELLDKLTTTPFSIWISYAMINGKTYRNINYLPPIVQTVAEVADDDEDEEF